jgi:hypothetical protein
MRLVGGGGSPKCDHCGTVQGFRVPHELKRTSQLELAAHEQSYGNHEMGFP